MNFEDKAKTERKDRTSSRAQDTLLFITANRLIRADFAGGPKSPVIDQIYEAGSPPSGAGLAVLADAAFALGPSGKRNVYILTTSLVTQVVSVTRSKVTGLDGQELAGALGFEAETISGINPFESALGSWLLGQDGDESKYWVSQMQANDLKELQVGLARHKGELRGLLHPGGVPRSLKAPEGSPGDEPWQRLELWPEQVLCVASTNGTSKAHVICVPPVLAIWHQEAEDWFGSPTEGKPRQCLAPDPQLLELGSGGRWSLSEDATLRVWLTAWAHELLSGVARVPVIVPIRPPMPDRRRWAIAAAVAVGVAAICGLHSMVLKRREARLNAELAAMQLPINHLASLKSRSDQLQVEVAKRQSEERDLKELKGLWEDTLHKEHHRHASLMAALSGSTAPEMVITSISEQPGLMRLNALSLSPDLTSFATNLSAHLNPLGWHLEPPLRRALGLRDDGGPWVLHYRVKPASTVPPSISIPSRGDLPTLIPAPLALSPETNQLARDWR